MAKVNIILIYYRKASNRAYSIMLSREMTFTPSLVSNNQICCNFWFVACIFGEFWYKIVNF